MTSKKNIFGKKLRRLKKGHWAYLWQDTESIERTSLINNEVIKGEFIFQELIDKFSIKPSKQWKTFRILDVGCGPISLVARNELGKIREGIDPLKYPNWVYDAYDKKKFKVHLELFEEFVNKNKYDVIIFYNALQHFADLKAVAKKCKQILANDGDILLSEYLRVPTNDAHIQFLEPDKLDKIFLDQGLKVESYTHSVRLPGYVERPDGSSIDLYLAKVS